MEISEKTRNLEGAEDFFSTLTGKDWSSAACCALTIHSYCFGNIVARFIVPFYKRAGFIVQNIWKFKTNPVG
ncbi:hypothetical protein KAX97_08060 [candidate division WOR-3 bacterium]|nr:hypothetical protein [candidate division WOR-3 bacterium]